MGLLSGFSVKKSRSLSAMRGMVLQARTERPTFGFA
jgi:hypothetical protein